MHVPSLIGMGLSENKSQHDESFSREESIDRKRRQTWIQGVYNILSSFFFSGSSSAACGILDP